MKAAKKEIAKEGTNPMSHTPQNGLNFPFTAKCTTLLDIIFPDIDEPFDGKNGSSAKMAAPLPQRPIQRTFYSRGLCNFIITAYHGSLQAACLGNNKRGQNSRPKKHDTKKL